MNEIDVLFVLSNIYYKYKYRLHCWDEVEKGNLIVLDMLLK